MVLFARDGYAFADPKVYMSKENSFRQILLEIQARGEKFIFDISKYQANISLDSDICQGNYKRYCIKSNNVDDWVDNEDLTKLGETVFIKIEA